MLVNEYGRSRGRDELVGRAVGEHVIGDHDDEQGIVDKLALEIGRASCRERV